MEAKFLPDGMYALGGNPVVVKDGTARLENGTLAGSILHLNDAIRNVRTVLGLPLVDVIDMATINPAKNMSVAESKGSIAVGKDADFTLIDDDVRVYETIRGGEVIYQR
jgi:N-acetylglucosamine-6-phosphate deacetylase